ARQKRHDVLFDALSKVSKPIKLVCLCRNSRKAKKLAAKYDVLDRVIFPGFKKNPYPWIKHAKGLVLSSDFEGFPTVLLEALALGVNVISSDCNFGPREILTGELAQWLVPPGDADALATKMTQYLEQEVAPPEANILGDIDSRAVALRYLQLVDNANRGDITAEVSGVLNTLSL
ncbi:MAG TPA: glycosyltransferase, partial [Marinagarivorans sp.]